MTKKRCMSLYEYLDLNESGMAEEIKLYKDEIDEFIKTKDPKSPYFYRFMHDEINKLMSPDSDKLQNWLYPADMWELYVVMKDKMIEIKEKMKRKEVYESPDSKPDPYIRTCMKNAMNTYIEEVIKPERLRKQCSECGEIYSYTRDFRKTPCSKCGCSDADVISVMPEMKGGEDDDDDMGQVGFRDRNDYLSKLVPDTENLTTEEIAIKSIAIETRSRCYKLLVDEIPKKRARCRRIFSLYAQYSSYRYPREKVIEQLTREEGRNANWRQVIHSCWDRLIKLREEQGERGIIHAIFKRLHEAESDLSE